MKIKCQILFLISIVIQSCVYNKSKKTVKDKLIAINPLTYTDVIYAGIKDSVYVSTFSGRISLRVHGNPTEKVITNIGDEVYALTFSKKRQEIIAATNSNGILIIDPLSGKVKQKLKVSDATWTLNIFLSEDENELYAFDLKGVNYAWRADSNYKLVEFPDNFPHNYLRSIKGEKIYTSGRGKLCVWNKEENRIIKESKIQGDIKDVDQKGDVLLIDDNAFIKYRISNDSVLFSKTHPSYIRVLPNSDTIRDTYMKLKLTDALFLNDKILTASADRSVRLWNNTGEVLKDFVGHNASITAIDIAKNKKQFVSVDAKGGIKFWELK